MKDLNSIISAWFLKSIDEEVKNAYIQKNKKLTHIKVKFPISVEGSEVCSFMSSLGPLKVTVDENMDGLLKVCVINKEKKD